MSASALRPLLRNARLATFRAAPIVRQSAPRARGYSTAPGAEPSKGTNPLLYVLGAGLLGGGAYYALSGGKEDFDPTKVKDAASPQEVDYQKVSRNEDAEAGWQQKWGGINGR